MMSKNVVDIVVVRQNIESGRLATKINMFGSVLLEDTMTCEAVKIMQLPDNFSFHKKGKWVPVDIYTCSDIDRCTETTHGYECSECGCSSLEKTSWCPDCGADMRDSNKADTISKRFKELVDSL